MKNMCKDRAKSGINPLLSTILWFVSIYFFYIVWGICEILFEFSFSVGKIIICLLITVYYGWFLIYKIMTEYEFEITEDEFRVKSVLSKKSKILLCEKLCDIEKICNSKKDLGTKVNLRLKKPLQKGTTAYIALKNNKKIKAIEIKASKRFIDELKKGIIT